MDATFITAIRTAAASAVATRFLAREDARTVGIFGTGVQGEFHALAVPEVRRIERILVWGSSPEKAREFAARLGKRCQAEVVPGEPVEAVAAADIVVAGTTSKEPIFSGTSIQAGAHVNGVGSHAPAERELDSELVERSRIVVDTYDAAFAEAGDLLIPIAEGRISRDQVGAELGEVITGRKPGRQCADEVTLFKSCGAAFQDAATARVAYRLARERGVGQAFEFGG
jgi:ornithine cyclodeaminase/alanine dehydrogenase-like protein (mu-crystallin family)